MTRSKYGAVRTTIDGITFASKAEARRYAELLLLARAGEIRGLELQPRFELSVFGYGNDTRIGDYVADFQYQRGPKGVLVIEDVKGVKTALYRWKKKHVEAQYNIRITEVA